VFPAELTDRHADHGRRNLLASFAGMGDVERSQLPLGHLLGQWLFGMAGSILTENIETSICGM
jgi:hypothetical protein